MCLTPRCKTAITLPGPRTLLHFSSSSPTVPPYLPGPGCLIFISSSLPARGNFSLMKSLGICTSRSLLIGYYLIISCSTENWLQSAVFRLQGSTHESPANFSHNGRNQSRAQVFQLSLKVTNPIHEGPLIPGPADLPKAHFLRPKHWELGLNI